MPSSLIVSALGLEAGGFAAAAVTFGVRVVTTLAVSSLLAKQMTPDLPQDVGNQGGRVQLPPATDNKLPVIYGHATVSPIITDAKISSDQQTMWYVLAFSEATDTGSLTFGDIFWDDKVLLFDENNPTEIVGWYNPNDDTRVTGVAGKISMWFYRNGSALPAAHLCRNLAGTGTNYGIANVNAIDVLNNTGIPEANRWSATDVMSNTVFAVLRVQYDADHGITGLGTIRAEVENSLGWTTGAGNGTGPGSVIRDYMQNSRYGCGIDLANIDTTSLSALDSFSYANGAFSIRDTDNVLVTNTYRYRINGPINTSNDCLTNLNEIATCVDSWIQWNEKTGKWGVVINQSLEQSGATTGTMTVLTADQIIGGVTVTPTDLNSMGNAIKITFPNYDLSDQTDFRYYDITDDITINANEPLNEISLNLPLVSNSVQATYLGYKRIWSSRSDLAITITTDYSGIRIDAGDVIAVKHEWYGWTPKQYGDGFYPGKPFRVTQVKEFKGQDGFLTAQISAIEYNDNVYTTMNPHFFSTVGFNGVSDPQYISQPGKPVITTPTTVTNYFSVASTVPAVGNVLGMEFWYSNEQQITGNNYSLYETQQNADKSLYVNNSIESVTVVNLPAGNYYWRTRAVGEKANSDFSEASDILSWSPTAGPVDGKDILDNSIPGSKVTTGDPAKVGQPDSGNFFDGLTNAVLAGLGAAAAYYLFQKGVAAFGKDEEPRGGGRGGGTTPNTVTLVADATNAQVGDTVTWTVTVNENYLDIDSYIG